MSLFDTVLYQPLFNALIWLYNVLPGHDMGLAIIVLTIFIRVVLWPLNQASLKSSKALQDLQPKIDALKEQYKDKKEDLAMATMELYKQEQVNPLSSCLPILIQLPVLIAMYSVFKAGLSVESLKDLYPFVSNPQTINATFFGILSLTGRSYVLAVLVAGAQFIQTKMMMVNRPAPALRDKEGAKDENVLAMVNQSMMYSLPLTTGFFTLFMPAGLGLYWLTTSLVAIFQQWLLFRKKTDDKKFEVKVETKKE